MAAGRRDSQLSLVTMANVATTRAGDSVCEFLRSSLYQGHEVHVVGVGALVGAPLHEIYAARPSILMDAVSRLAARRRTRSHYTLIADGFDVL